MIAIANWHGPCSSFEIMNNSNTVGILIGLGLASPGCHTAETKPACAWVHSPEECNEGAEGVEGDDEVEVDVDTETPHMPCIAAPDGTTRTIHQCHGYFTASLSFMALGSSCPQALGNAEACQESHEFGIEPYPLTQVMACCDPYGDDSDLDEYLTACAADLAQQICTSMSLRIEHLMAEGLLAKTAESTAMQKWIATHQADCFDAFWTLNQANGPGELAGSWSIPNKPAWQVLIQDFTITIDNAAVVNVSLPDDAADYIDCKDNQRNDAEIFEWRAALRREDLLEFGGEEDPLRP